MGKPEKVKFLVVDSGAFIKNAPISEYGENIITTCGIVKEIKDKATKQRLQVLPYELKFQEPLPEIIKHVTEFSKKTGDYPSLSAVDIQVIALTYQLEKEHVGIDHLNKEPVHGKVTAQPAEVSKSLAGFYYPDKEDEDPDVEHINSEKQFESPNVGHTNIEEQSESPNVEHIASEKEPEDTNVEHITSVEKLEDLTIDVNRKEQCEDSNVNIVNSKEQSESSNVDVANSDENKSSDCCSESQEDRSSAEEADEDSDSAEHNEVYDEDENWITPFNIDGIKQKMGVLAITDDNKPIVVACVTTDFAVQNVLLQMGLHVISVDGMLIKHTKTFILRCYACYKTTSIMTKQFCTGCGNKTLKRVAVSINKDGSKKIHINFKRPINIRGTKYSLPMPRGGKHAENPVLCEDQPLAQNRPAKSALTKVDMFSPDYEARSSPFALNDVYSRAAQLGIRKAKATVSKKNPNEPVKRIGKKKRNKKV